MSTTLPPKNSPPFLTSLQNWVEDTFFSNQKDPNSLLSSINLSRFGLNNPQKVMAFFKTLAGKALETEIQEKRALELEMQQVSQKQLWEELLLARLRALLLSLFFDKESEASNAKQLELLMEQQDELLNKNKPDFSAKNFPDSGYHLEQTLNYYDKILSGLSEQINTNAVERKELEDSVIVLSNEKQQAQELFNLSQESIKQIETILDDSEPVTETRLETLIDQRRDQARECSAKIATHLDSNQPFVPQDLMNQLFTTNLQLRMLNQILSVQKNDFYYVDRQGLTVDSYQKAAFVLPNAPTNKLQLVLWNDKLYLLQPGMTLDSIQNSQELRNEARQYYKSSKENFMSAPVSIQRNYDKTQANLDKRLEQAQELITQNTANKLQIIEQIKRVQAEKAFALALVKPVKELKPMPQIPTPVADLKAPRPEFTPSPAAKIPTPRPDSSKSTQWYKEQLLMLRKQSQLTPSEIHTMAQNAPQDIRPSLTHYVGNLLSNYTKNIAFTHQQRTSLLDSLGQFNSNNVKATLQGFKATGAAEPNAPAASVFNPSPNPFSRK